MSTGQFVRRLNGSLDRRSRGKALGIPLSYFKMTAVTLIMASVPSLILKAADHISGVPFLAPFATLVALVTLLMTIVAFVYYLTLLGYATVRDVTEFVGEVRRVIKENAERRRQRTQPRGGGWVSVTAALLLPSSIRDDGIATARDVLARETDDASSRRVVCAVVCRLIRGLIRDGVIERKQRLAGRLAGVAFVLTVVSGIQTIVGTHFDTLLGVTIVLASVILGGLIGGWAGGLGEKRVP